MKFLLKQNKPIYYIVLQLLTIFIIVHHASCSSCNQDKDSDKGGDTYTQITMRLPSGPLVGKDKKIEITFELADATKEAALQDFHLRVSLQETGDTGSKISYTNVQGKVIETTKVHEPLTHFTSVNQLTPANSSFKIPFTLVTAPKTTQIEAAFGVC